MLFWKKFIFFLLLYSCVPTTKPIATSSGVTPSIVSIDRIATSGNELVITGSGLGGFNQLVITDSANSFEKSFKVTAVSSTRIVAENISTFSLPVNELLELVLSSASGQTAETVIPITFSLQPGSVSTANIQPQAITATKFKGVAGNPPAGTVPEWDGISQFNFVYPSGGGGGGGGGSVTSVGRGVGILGSGVPITSAGTISVDVGSRGDPAVTKIPFFTRDDRMVLSDPAKLYFYTGSFPDRNFVIFNDGLFSIGHVATATDVPADYLTITETGTVEIPENLEVGATNDWSALTVGGSTVCLNNGQNCAANGNVYGPGSSSINEVAVFSGTTGKNIAGGGKLIGNLVTGPAVAIAGNLAQLDATGKIISDSTIAAANVPIMISAAGSADRPILSAGASKDLISAAYTIPASICPNGQILKSNGTNFVCLDDLVGTGNVVGPSSPTVGTLSYFSSTAPTSITNSSINYLDVVTMMVATPVFNEVMVSAGANKSVQSSGILSTDLVTMAASASPTDLILLSAGNKSAKASTVSINNVVTMATPTVNPSEVLISDGMGSRSAIGSGLAIANVPTMATNSTGANTPILAVTNTKALKAAPYTFPATACAIGEILKSTGVNFTCQTDIGTGLTPGDVMGPAAATLTNLASFNLATGKSIADSGISSSNVVTMTTAAAATDNLLSSAGANKSVKDSGILSTNLVTMAANAAAANTVLVTTGSNKVAQGTTLLSTDIVTMTSNALAAGTVLTSAGLNKSAQDSGIVGANIVTNVANFSEANRVAISAGGTRALTETGYTIPTAVCVDGFTLVSDGANFGCSATALGDVEGPAASTDNAVARFDLATGKIIQNSPVIIADTTGAITGTQSVTAGGTAVPLLRADGNTDNQQAGTLFLSQGDAYGFKIFYDATNTNDGLTFLERRNNVETSRMNILNGGQVQIGSVPDSDNVGAARLILEGPNGNGTGPHQAFYTTADNFPLRQFLNWSHDSVWDCFDCYHDGAAWRNSNASSAFRWSKTATDLILAGTNAPTAGGTEALTNFFWVNESGPATFSRINNNGGSAPYTQVGGTITLAGPRGTQAQWVGLNTPAGNNDAASEMWNQNGGWGWQRAWIVNTNAPPSVRFDGNITAQSYANNSDAQLKKDVTDIPQADIDRFFTLEIKKFRWKDKPYLGRSKTDTLTAAELETRYHAGVMAQDVEAIFPDAVTTSTKTVIDFHGTDTVATAQDVTVKSVELTDIVGLMAKALQDVRTKIAEGVATSTDNAIVRYDGITGKKIQNSGVIIDDLNNITGVAAFTSSGNMTVDTNTFVVDSANNRVGIGIAAPTKGLWYSGVDATFDGTGNNGNVVIRNPDANPMAGGTMLRIQNSTANTGGSYNNYILMVADSDGTPITFGSMGYETANSFEIYNPNNTALSLQTKGTGNVGIGISNPTNKLQVSGTFGVSGVTTFNVGASSSTFPTGRGTSGQALTTDGAGALSWSTVTVPNVVTNAGASTDNAIARFDLATGKVIQDSPVIIADTTGAITGTQSVTVSGTAIPLLRANGSTDNQQAGTLFLSQGDDFGFKIYYDALNTFDGMRIVERRVGADTIRMSFENGGNVGIGVLDPAFMLDVAGNVQFNNVRLGDVPHGATWACMSNDNTNTTTGYGICQGDAGTTLVNAPTGQTVQQRINNATVTTTSNTGLAVTGTLSSTGNGSIGGTLAVTGATTLTGGINNPVNILMSGGTDRGIFINGGNCGGACAQPEGANGNDRGMIHISQSNPNNPNTGMTFGDNATDDPIAYIGGFIDDRGNNRGRFRIITRGADGWVQRAIWGSPATFSEGMGVANFKKDSNGNEIKTEFDKSFIFTVPENLMENVRIALPNRQPAENETLVVSGNKLIWEKKPDIEELKNRIAALEGRLPSNPTAVKSLASISSDQDNLYFLRPQQENGIESENERLKKEIASLRKENKSFQKRLEALEAKLNPQVTSDSSL
jgi:Chaperone of endosialidase